MTQLAAAPAIAPFLAVHSPSACRHSHAWPGETTNSTTSPLVAVTRRTLLRRNPRLRLRSFVGLETLYFFE